MRRVDDWKLKLIDLSRRNRLVHFRPTRSSTVRFEKPGIKTLFERLVVKGRHLEVWSPPDESDGSRAKKVKRTQVVTSETDPRQLERIMRNISRRSASEYRERGVRILHVAFGMMNWTDAGSNMPITSPIIITPVELTRKTSRDPYRFEVPAVEDEAILNPALRLKLQYDHKIELPELPDFEELNILEYLQEVEKAVAPMGWTVDPVVQMGLFSFYKLVMYQDLNENAEEIAGHPLMAALAGVVPPPKSKKDLPSEDNLDANVDPRETYQVLDADGSQQLCIQYALNGQSFVMHGPPGTGKSQTIANIISEFIAHGKNVLFVSEKMAALEVVYNRLRARNLDDFCLELHSHKANKREVVAELKRSLDEHIKARGGLTDEELERLRTRRDQLNAYAASLHQTRNPIGVCAYDLFGRLARLEEAPFLPSQYPKFGTLDQKTLFGLEEGIRRLSNAWTVVTEGDGFPWKGCRDERFTPETRSAWNSLLDGALGVIRELDQDSRNYAETLGLEMPHTPDDYERLRGLVELISMTPRPPANWFEDVDLGGLKDQVKARRDEWEDYWTSRRSLERFYDSRFIVLPPGTGDRIEREWRSVGELVRSTPKDDGGLLKQMRELRDCARELPRLIQGWRDGTRRITNILGLKSEAENLDDVRKLNELAALCEGEDRPERGWLDRSRLEETRDLLKRLLEDRDRRRELREVLKDYDDTLYSLDLEALAAYFEGPGRSVLRYLTPSFYRAKSSVSEVREGGDVPDTIVEDLRAASELVALEEKLDAGLDGARRTLRSYYADDEPDFEGVKRALDVADKALKLTGRSRAPKLLRDNLVKNTSPVEELVVARKKISDSLASWRSTARSLRGLIPQRRLPNSGRSISKSPLGNLEEWARDLEERLSSLSRTSAEALATRKSDYPPSFGRLVSDLGKAEGLQQFSDSVEERSPELRMAFGGQYRGLLTDWNVVLGAINWTERLVQTLKRGVPEALKRGVSEGGPVLPSDPRIGERLQKLNEDLDVVNSRFESPLWPENRSSISLVDTRGRLEALRSRVDDIQTWVDYNATRGRLEADGLGGFADELVRRKMPREKLLDVFQKAMYQGLLDMVFGEDPALEKFRGKGHEQLISDFKELDRRFIRLSPQRVIEIANEQKPTGVFVQSPDSEITILMREAAKKRRHMPLRHLFERIPHLIRRLKPCLMMSPISVSQFLKPGGLHFDLVVFDEASQIYTEDAVGSIYRGDQLVVAGDPKQLPPTPFFQYSVEEDFDWDESEYEFDVFDSVLDECMSIGLPVRMLRWHYRSRHDSLISFSNDRFYDGRLVLFPASRMGAEDLGLEFVHVRDGIYDRGGARNNTNEAEVVADMVFDQFTRYPDKTLGVVTFSIAQMNTVQDAVERRLRERPEYETFFKENRLNGFFVKNLENVQGDERDVMIFSVGYGYDVDGRITMNFGPLNKAGGERRLNVAITRAREKVVLVSSIRYNDIRLESTRAEGVHSLHHYLRYAERRPRKLENGAEVEYASALETDVAEAVERLGYSTVPSVGSSSFRVDLGVVDPKDPGRFILGVMCDGETYKDANMARDRDRLRTQVLESLGWSIHRVWSPDWVQRRKTEVRRLKKALKDAEATVEVKAKPVAEVKVSVEKAKVEETPGNELPEVEPYTFSNPRPRHLFSRYSSEHRDRYLKQYRTEVRRLLPVVVNDESPIHLDLAARRLNKAFRLSRATEAFNEAFREEADDLRRKRRINVNGEFLWSKGVGEVKVRVPIEGVKESFRSVEHIAPEEIEQAMKLVAGHSLGISEESLVSETAALLGFKRMGENIQSKVTQIYETTRRRGILTESSGLVYLKKRG
jgi:hypothetical protein